MTQDTQYLHWTHITPPDATISQYIVPDPATAVPVIKVECHAPTEPPPTPPINGRIVAGDLEWDVELSAWVLENVRVEPIP